MKPSEAPEWILQLDRLYDRMMIRADRLQDYWRDYAFLGLDEEIRVAGDPETRATRIIKVRLLTLQMFIELCAVRSPFLVGGRIRPEHVAQILWRLSPEYDAAQQLRVAHASRVSGEAVSGSQTFGEKIVSGGTPKPAPETGALPSGELRKEFIASIAQLNFRSSVRAISRYLDRMLIDRPASDAKASEGASISNTSFAASVVHALASIYGWSDETILNLPMPALFQYLRKIQRDNDPEAITFHLLRDRFTQKIFQKYRARHAASSRCEAQNAPVCAENPRATHEQSR